MPNYKPNLNRASKRTFWQAYDNLGILFLINAFWLFLFFIPSASTSLFQMAYLVSRDRSIKVKTFFKGILYYFLKSIFIAAISVAIPLILAFNIKFYLVRFGKLGIIPSGVTFWILILSLLSSIYVFPLVARNYGILKTLKYTYILTLDNFTATIKISMALLVFLILSIFLPIIMPSILAVFTQNALLEIEKKYNPDIEIEEPNRKFSELWPFA